MKGYTTERSVQILIQALKAHGIDQVIASPGTTNLTFVASIQQDPFFRIVSAPDERSAAYMACGLAAESGRPVVITCTGATASRNYLPGLTEAYYRKLPVLAVTGSLDVRRSGHLTAQFVDRSAQMPDVVRHSVNIRVANTKDDEWQATVQSQTAILELTRHGGGPVHINLETAHSPVYNVASLPPIRVLRRFTPRDALPPLPPGRVGIWVGAHVPWTPALTEAVDAFCDACDAPVFCDHASNYRGRYEANFALACYQQSRSFEQFRPDVMIHIGEVSGDYPSMRIIGAAQVWRVNPDGEIRDTFRRLVNTFEMEEIAFFRHYAKLARKPTEGYRDAVLRHQARLAAAVPKDMPFSNVWAAAEGAKMLPEGACLHFGILHSFRAWSFRPIPKSVICSCNTGGFGIDGCLSTVLGASLANPGRIHFVALGDLAFFYDLNSLGNRHVGRNLRILLVNNGKGVEFRNFTHPAYQFGDEADAFIAAGGHYGNRSRDLVRHYAGDLGFEYLAASNKEEFAAVAPRFYTPELTDRPMVLELFTTSADDNRAYEMMTLIEGGYAPPPPKPAAPPAKAAPAKPFARVRAKNRKIAILTFHRAHNCGAALQGWALQTILERLGYEPEFPDCNLIGFRSRFDPAPLAGEPLTRFQRFLRHLRSLGVEDRKRFYFRRFLSRCLRLAPMALREVERRYDAVLVGSDQVWNSGITRRGSSYFLTTLFKRKDLRRYSYAISYGDYVPKPERIPVLRQAARLFENFSVRENLLPDLTDRFGRAPTEDVDPTLLLTRDDFNRIACPRRLVRGKYLLVYSLFYVESTWKAAREMARRMGLKLVILQMYQYGAYRIADGRDVDYAVSPDRFLAYYRDAEAVITSSFHGTAFSLIYRKPFVVTRNYRNEVPLRSQELVRRLGEEMHIVQDPSDGEAMLNALLTPVKETSTAALAKLARATVARLRATLPDLSALPRPAPRTGVAWLGAKLRGGVRCLRENGLGYTIRRFGQKLRRRL